MHEFLTKLIFDLRHDRKRWLKLLTAYLPLGCLAVFTLWLFWTPPLQSLRTKNPRTTRLMEIRRGQALKKHRPYRVNQHWVPLDRISEHLRHAVLAAEDDAFYRHRGVDFNATWICLKQDLKRRGFARGGSTITQQVVKNLYLSPRKSMPRKLKEAVTALRLERVLEKRRIFEIYLNIAEWGPGIFGAEAAARRYFKKSAAELDAAEAAALAAVLPSPLRHSPVREDRFLGWRKPWVLRQMRCHGFLPPAAPDALPPPAAEEIQELTEADDSAGADAPEEARPGVEGGAEK